MRGRNGASSPKAAVNTLRLQLFLAVGTDHSSDIGGYGVAVCIGNYAVNLTHVAVFSHGDGVRLALVAGCCEGHTVLVL